MEALSTMSEMFTRKAHGLLQRDGELLIFSRRANVGGGCTGWHLIRHPEQLDTLLKSAVGKTAFSVILTPTLHLRGIANEIVEQDAAALLQQVNELLLVSLSSQDLYADAHYADNKSKVRDFFRKHQGQAVAIGRYPAWEDDQEAITGYVPDADGVARPGAY